jgi:Flp pilus assembly CpaF family ATPase
MEKHSYIGYLTGEKDKNEFKRDLENYLRRNFPDICKYDKEEEIEDANGQKRTIIVNPDLEEIMKRIRQSLFGYDVLQPLIDNEETTDIKICSPYDIRVRIKGKAYQSDAHFIDEMDEYRFIEGLVLRNGLNFGREPVLTFTDAHDKNYLLRFTVSSPVVTTPGYPYLHIRKVAKVKKTFDDLIVAGMLNDKIKMYLIDRAKTSRCVVFAGPPGSGKTSALNAFIEYIPRTRETLVIQENDELFTEQSGFMFKHVTHGFHGEPICTLEDLGRMALVEGCNEFVIGEVKGGEMRAVATLLNAGGYGAYTIHSNNAYEVLPKSADLVKYGSDYSFDEAKRMLKSIDTIVYMDGYKIREILEVTGYDDEKHDYNYVHIYKYGI